MQDQRSNQLLSFAGFRNVNILIEKGANINARDFKGESALIQAFAKGKSVEIKVYGILCANLQAVNKIFHSMLQEIDVL